jgi:hypothetical protein
MLLPRSTKPSGVQMTTKDPADKYFLEVRKDSQFAKVLERIASNPAITTSEVCKMWAQKARGGMTGELTPTRGAFLLDLLADATEGMAFAYKPSKGVAVVKGVKDSLKVDVNTKPAVVSHGEKTKVIYGGEIARPAPKPEPVNVSVDVSATLTPAGEKVSGEVEIIFPEAPANAPSDGGIHRAGLVQVDGIRSGWQDRRQGQDSPRRNRRPARNRQEHRSGAVFHSARPAVHHDQLRRGTAPQGSGGHPGSDQGHVAVRVRGVRCRRHLRVGRDHQ